MAQDAVSEGPGSTGAEPKGATARNRVRPGFAAVGLAVRAAGRLRHGARRVRLAALPIVQCAIAAGLAWFVAADLVGHSRPFFAPIAAVLSLGASLGSRLRRAGELVVGVSLGVLVGDLLISVIGSGWWQIALVVALAVAVAVFADGGTLLVAQAGSSAVLVATLLPPGGSAGLDRCIDALIGGAVGLLVAAVLPANPLGPAQRHARKLLDELAGVLYDIADALRTGRTEAAARALERARQSQPLIDGLRAAVRTGREVSTVSPLRRPHRRELARFAELAERSDYAVRNTRVLARRALAAAQDGEPGLDLLADTADEIATVVQKLTGQLGREGDRRRIREPLLDVVRDAAVLADPDSVELGLSGQVMVAQLRSIVIDLLQASGLTRAEAMEALRACAP